MNPAYFCRPLGRSCSRAVFHCFAPVRTVRVLHSSLWRESLNQIGTRGSSRTLTESANQSQSNYRSKVQSDELVSAVPRLPFHNPVYFDTHQVVQELQTAGYSVPQAETLVTVLNKSLQSSLAAIAASQLSQQQLDILELKLHAAVDSVRTNVVLLEKSTVAALRSENEGLKGEITSLKFQLEEEVGKVQSGVRLDMNLEKSRNKEESTIMEQKIKDTNNRIDKEVAYLKTHMESSKLESIKYLVGGIFSIVTIILSVVLGMWRLMK